MFKSKDLLVPLRFATKKDEEEEEPQGSGCCSTSCGGGGDQGDDDDNQGGCQKSKSARGDSFGPAGLAMLRRQMTERLTESLARSL